MGKIIECSADETGIQNTGAKDQCLTAPVVKHTLASDDQEFATKEAAKDLAVWKTDIAAKKLFPLFEVEELAIADTEDTYWEGRNKYKTATGKKIRTFNLVLGECSHKAIASFHGKKMKVYEHTSANELKGVSLDGVKIKGQGVRIEVGKMIESLDDKPQYTPVTLIYDDYKEYESNPVKLMPTWSPVLLYGIFDVELNQVSASASSIKFTVDTGCSGDEVHSLEDADVVLKDAAGAAYTHSFVAADANGVYTLTGTGFANGFTVSLNGVVKKVEQSYEAVAPLAITI